MPRSLDFGSNEYNYWTGFLLFFVFISLNKRTEPKLRSIFVFVTPTPKSLSLLHSFSRWPIIQKVRRSCVDFQYKTKRKSVHSSDWLSASNFRFSISLPYLGFFSPFPHGTCSLSVIELYLGLEGGPPFFFWKQNKILFSFESKIKC